MFELSGQVLVEFTDAVVDFILGEGDTLDSASALIEKVTDLEEQAFRLIRDA